MIDDEDVVRMLVGEILDSADHDVTSAESPPVDLALALIASGELELRAAGGLRVLEPAAEEVPAPGLSVLVVEEDDAQAQLVTKALERALAGARVARAGSVARASELARGSHWSLAVVDHVLPDGGGLQVLDTLRAEDPTLPIVMLTGQGSEETAIEVIRHGASYYIVKGRDYLDALERRVRSLLTA